MQNNLEDIATQISLRPPQPTQFARGGYVLLRNYDDF